MLKLKNILLFTLLSTSAAYSAPPTVKNIVLVHGAFVDGSGWRPVAEILENHGYKVSIVQQPLTDVNVDIAATQRVVDRQDGPVVLVGHSYGGLIISNVGTDAKVKALVYVAALQPDKGESISQLVKTMPSPSDDLEKTNDGYFFLNSAKFATVFAADLPRKQADFMAISQVPIVSTAFDTVATAAAWHEKPSYGIVPTQDKTLNPDLARWMYKRSNAKITELKGSHAVYISQAAAVAKVIEGAALDASKAQKK